jgi:hypothetical protein
MRSAPAVGAVLSLGSFIAPVSRVRRRTEAHSTSKLCRCFGQLPPLGPLALLDSLERRQIHTAFDFGDEALAQHVNGERIEFHSYIAVSRNEFSAARVGRLGEKSGGRS